MRKEKRKYKDRREYLIQAVKKRRKKLKQMAVEYLGGKCMICGYNRCINALEFHHLEDKRFGFSSRGITRSWQRTKEELKKCVLVCSNCHKEIHAGLVQLPSVRMDEKRGENGKARGNPGNTVPSHFTK
jgi:hypothetical protein